MAREVPVSWGNREKAVPVILFPAFLDAELLDRAAAGNVMAYPVKPVGQADVEAAVALAMYRFGQYQAVRQEARDLENALEEGKAIERAKGVLANRLRLDEQEAFRRLKRMASSHNRKLVEAAQEVLAADRVFQRMEDEACTGRTGIGM